MRVVQLGPRCNNACVFCAQAGTGCCLPQDALGSLPAPEAQSSLALVGGEPTLFDDLPGLLRTARDCGHSSIVVQTNGRRLAYPGYARELTRAGATALDVSLHGSTKEMHDYHTSVPGSFVQTVRGISHAVDIGLHVVVSAVITRSNFRHLAELVRLVRSLDVSALRLRMPVVVGHAAALRSRVVPDPSLVRPWLRKAQAESRGVGLPLFDPLQRGSPPFPFVDFISDAVPSVSRASSRPGRADFVSGRPRPGRNEHRGRKRRSGEELQSIPLRWVRPCVEEH